MKTSVRAVEKCGLVPLVVTMDQCSTNMKMVRDAGGTMTNPFLDINGRKVAVMYDTPHLIKNARNAIFKYNAVYNKKIASKLHIKQLFDVDVQQESSLRLVPKLKPKNIDLPPFASMNVALATRTLSESCAVGMRYYVETGELPTEALQTADFIQIHDKLFDTFNSKDKYKESVGKVCRIVCRNCRELLSF